MSTEKLGFVRINATEVVTLAKAELDRIAAIKAEHAEAMIQELMAPRKGFSLWFFFGGPAKTREQALKRINDDMFTAWEYASYLPTYKSPREQRLQDLIAVGEAMLQGVHRDPMIDVSIEAASWLF